MIKIAFIKFGGLAAGGTEKGLQTIAANLPKDRFEVDYYYCDAAPYIGSDWKHPDTDPSRKKYLEDAGVNLIKFFVSFKNITTPTHDWVNTNFWEKFDESKYDIIQSARAGHPEYPFININKTPLVDLVTLPGMAENKANSEVVIHISEFQAQTWINAGGLRHKVKVIPVLTDFPKSSVQSNLRENLGIKPCTFVFGFHQRVDDGIFSSVPLEAYSHLEKELGNDVAFLIMGGSKLYQNQIVQLGLKSAYQIVHSGNYDDIQKFLNTCNVFAHGRSDGETYGMAIAEAMRSGLPIVSHVAPAMGHVETIGDAGIVVNSIEEYKAEMFKLISDNKHYNYRKTNAIERFAKHLSLESNIQKYIEIYEDIYNRYHSVIKEEWLDEWMTNDEDTKEI